MLELHALIPPVQLRRLRDGMTAVVSATGGEPITGSVVRVAPAVDVATQLGLVRVALAATGDLQVGTAATGRIAIAQRPGVVIPAAAVRRSLVGEDEVVVCEAGTAHVRKVALGRRGELDEITDGLKAGEQVVVDHVLGLEDGQPLTAGDTGTAAEPATGSAARAAGGVQR